MSERITETRYGIAQLVSLVEMNAGVIVLVLGLFAYEAGLWFGAAACVVFAAISIYTGIVIIDRGHTYRLAERFGGEPDWTFEDIDEDELRENGYVIINE